MLHDFRNCADLAGHDGAAVGHRLERRQPETLLPDRGHDRDIAPRDDWQRVRTVPGENDVVS